MLVFYISRNYAKMENALTDLSKIKLINTGLFLYTIFWYQTPYMGVRVMVMVFNATYNNISVISCLSVLLVEKPGENHRLAASH